MAGGLDLSDAIYLLSYQFQAGDEPPCMESADFDNSGGVEITDAIALLNYLFLAGYPPASPGPATSPCGPDPDPPDSPKHLGCLSYDC